MDRNKLAEANEDAREEVEHLKSELAKVKVRCGVVVERA